MSYSITFSDTSLKQLDKLSTEVQKRIISTLKRCQIRPYSHVKKLVGSPHFRLRVGDYRIIIEIFDNELKIHVIELGRRKKIYKK